MDAENASPPIGELAKVLQQLEQAPAMVLEVLERIREAKLNKMELPESLPPEFQALAGFVHSPTELKKRGFWEYLLADKYSLSYATPQKFGAHRAERISDLFPDMKIADVSCGVGGQLLELGKAGIETIGLEKDPLRYALAKINVQLAIIKNYVQFKPILYNEDALDSAVKLTEKITVVLCDSLREGGKDYSPS
ncbi:MAG: class I SAM-dependent methyltransferase, partial [Nanoarchaeota archaeon]